MSMQYYKVFKVPFWMTVSGPKSEFIINFFRKSNGYYVPYVPQNYKLSVEAMKNKGWSFLWSEPKLVLPDTFVAQTFASAVKSLYGAHAAVEPASNIGMINRTIKSDDDYTRIFNEIFVNLRDLNLSQILRIGDICHADGNDNRHIFFSKADHTMSKVAARLSDNLITIGEGADHTIDVSGIDESQLHEYLIQALMDHPEFSEFAIKNNLISKPTPVEEVVETRRGRKPR